jgi:hypothetical protein
MPVFRFAPPVRGDRAISPVVLSLLAHAAFLAAVAGVAHGDAEAARGRPAAPAPSERLRYLVVAPADLGGKPPRARPAAPRAAPRPAPPSTTPSPAPPRAPHPVATPTSPPAPAPPPTPDLEDVAMRIHVLHAADRDADPHRSAPTVAPLVPPAIHASLIADAPVTAGPAAATPSGEEENESPVRLAGPGAGDGSDDFDGVAFEPEVHAQLRSTNPCPSHLLLTRWQWHAYRGLHTIVSFVIGTDGEVDARTIRVLLAPDSALGRAIVEHLRMHRVSFWPARHHGRPVRVRSAVDCEVT